MNERYEQLTYVAFFRIYKIVNYESYSISSHYVVGGLFWFLNRKVTSC